MFPKRFKGCFSIADALEDDAIFLDLLDSSDDEQPRRGGSKPGKRPNLNRCFEMGNANILRDYFVDDPVYSDELFRRRFRMSKGLFHRISEAVIKATPFLKQRTDALRKPGPSPLQKITAAVRMLAYGVAADAVDEYCRISESLAHDCLTAFVDGFIRCFEQVYLREPTPADINRIQAYNAEQGWPGQAFSIDCMHWEWKNCPKAYAGS
jgi:hypothetical protein